MAHHLFGALDAPFVPLRFVQLEVDTAADRAWFHGQETCGLGPGVGSLGASLSRGYSVTVSDVDSRSAVRDEGPASTVYVIGSTFHDRDAAS
jgi:hypothetical protein